MFYFTNFHMSQINSFIKHNNGKLIGKKNYSSSWHSSLVPALSPRSPCYCPFSQCVGLPCLVVKNPPASVGDVGSISGSGRSPGEGRSKPLQHSCLGSPMDRGGWRAALRRVSKSWTWLSDWTTKNNYSQCVPVMCQASLLVWGMKGWTGKGKVRTWTQIYSVSLPTPSGTGKETPAPSHNPSLDLPCYKP